MKAGGGRLKGSKFERDVAKMIVEEFAGFGIVKEDCFRTPLSGGHLYASKTDPGDLQMSQRLKELLPFCIECKKYRTLNWQQLVCGMPKKSLWAKWWAQANRAAGLKQVPLLVFAANGTPPFCLSYGLFVSQWRECSEAPVLRTVDDAGTEIYVYRFSELLRHLKWQAAKQKKDQFA